MLIVILVLSFIALSSALYGAIEVIGLGIMAKEMAFVFLGSLIILFVIVGYIVCGLGVLKSIGGS